MLSLLLSDPSMRYLQGLSNRLLLATSYPGEAPSSHSNILNERPPPPPESLQTPARVCSQVLFLVLGVGADDIFVLVDAWKQSIGEVHRGGRPQCVVVGRYVSR